MLLATVLAPKVAGRHLDIKHLLFGVLLIPLTGCNSVNDVEPAHVENQTDAYQLTIFVPETKERLIKKETRQKANKLDVCEGNIRVHRWVKQHQQSTVLGNYPLNVVLTCV